jgi:hypothetical protein
MTAIIPGQETLFFWFFCISTCYGLDVVPKVCWSPIPWHLKVWPHLEIGFSDVIKLRCDSGQVFLEKKEQGAGGTHTHTHTRDSGGGHLRTEAAWESATLSATWFWTSGLHTCETIKCGINTVSHLYFGQRWPWLLHCSLFHCVILVPFYICVGSW